MPLVLVTLSFVLAFASTASEGQSDFEYVLHFEEDGLTYQEMETGSVYVTGANSSLSGDVVIPQSVEYEGITYPVKGLWELSLHDMDHIYRPP